MKPRTTLIPLPGKAQILLTKYIQQPGHYSELLIRHAQDSNTFQAWPSSLDHTCFQGPEAKNNSGASHLGQQPGLGVAAGPLLSSTTSKSRGCITLQPQKPPWQASFPLCQSPPSKACSFSLPLHTKNKSGNLETSKVLWCIVFKNNNHNRGPETQERIQETLFLISAPLKRH